MRVTAMCPCQKDVHIDGGGMARIQHIGTLYKRHQRVTLVVNV